MKRYKYKNYTVVFTVHSGKHHAVKLELLQYGKDEFELTLLAPGEHYHLMYGIGSTKLEAYDKLLAGWRRRYPNGVVNFPPKPESW